MVFLRILLFIIGLLIVGATLFSAVRTFVLPRAAQDKLTRFLFRRLHAIFRWYSSKLKNFAAREHLMAFFAPVGLLILLPFWLFLVTIGYTLMFWASGISDWLEAFTMSGSSLLTLGFAKGDTFLQLNLAFTEAVIGLILVALLIAYLPTMYSAFSQRELSVSMLSVRAGSPPSPVELLLRMHRLRHLDQLGDFFLEWETWFAHVEESHTALSALVFFRSPLPEHSWITAAGAVLDSAALMHSTVKHSPKSWQAAICLRAGFIAMRRLSDFFNIPYNPDPHFPADSITISKESYLEVCATLAEKGIPLVDNLDDGWVDFAGWRVNYDAPLLALCELTMAPKAFWSSEFLAIHQKETANV